MEPFIGEIIMFGGNFAPRGWALCDGQLLPIAQNSALFSILGTTYGGDGRTTFGLPDLRGRVAMHAGSGPGLTPRQLGAKGGEETVTLSVNQIPSHDHTLNASSAESNQKNAADGVLAKAGIYQTGNPDEVMDRQSIGNTGANQAHDNVQPFQTVNYIIALTGTYPSRN